MYSQLWKAATHLQNILLFDCFEDNYSAMWSPQLCIVSHPIVMKGNLRGISS